MDGLFYSIHMYIAWVFISEPFAFPRVICNGNRTEWSTIKEVIGRVISNQPSM